MNVYGVKEIEVEKASAECLLKEFGHKRNRELSRATLNNHPNIPEAVQGQPVLHSDFQASLVFRGKPCLKHQQQQ